MPVCPVHAVAARPTAPLLRRRASGAKYSRHDRFFAARDRLRARPLHHRPERCQARGRHRPAQSLAAPAAGREAARRGAAQEHPDDRPDRRRQDRDLPPPRQARRRSLHQDRSDQVHRGRLCRARRRADRARPGGDRDRADTGEKAQGRAGARPARRRGAGGQRAGRRERERHHQGRLPQAPARGRAQRQGDRDRGAGDGRRHAAVRNTGHAGRADGRDLDRRYFRQIGRRPHQDAAASRWRNPTRS